MGEILLVATDWQFRALVRAQLLEEGFGVRAQPSLEQGIAYQLGSHEQFRLIIVDVEGTEAEARMLWDLWRLSGEPPLILCEGRLDRWSQERAALPPGYVLLRPFRVGDLIALVRKVFACPGNGARGE